MRAKESATPSSCPACDRPMRWMTIAGRTAKFRNLERLPIPARMGLITCDKCLGWWVPAPLKDLFLEMLMSGYRRVLRRRVQTAIRDLREHITQRQLEKLLGLSPGYLSHLLTGEKRTPSPELVNHLAIIARDPKIRLDEIRHYWAEAEPIEKVEHKRGRRGQRYRTAAKCPPTP